MRLHKGLTELDISHLHGKSWETADHDEMAIYLTSKDSKIKILNHIDIKRKELSVRGSPLLNYETQFVCSHLSHFTSLDLGIETRFNAAISISDPTS